MHTNNWVTNLRVKRHDAYEFNYAKHLNSKLISVNCIALSFQSWKNKNMEWKLNIKGDNTIFESQGNCGKLGVF